MNSPMDQLSAFIAQATLEPKLVPLAQSAIADTFGCMLRGSKSDVVAQLIQSFTGEKGDAPIYGLPDTASPGTSALINAAAAHVWDLDDWEEPGNTHVTAVLFPALLAAAQSRSVTGQELALAYTVGFEVIARLGECVTLDHYTRGFHSTATLGAIAAAAAVSKLLGLTQSQIAHALALSASQATGYTLQFGTSAKPIQAGFAARAGLESAFFARAGLTGNPNVLFDPRGFAGLMGIAGNSLKPLGAPWALEEYGVIQKLWPSCGYIHRLMTSARELAPKYQGKHAEITAIRAYIPDFYRQILPFDRPTIRREALFSIHACLAHMIVQGDLTLEDSEQNFWEHPETAAVMQKTSVFTHPAERPELNIDPHQPDRLEIDLGTETLKSTCAYPLGASKNPMGAHDLQAKFCALTGRDEAAFAQTMAWPEATNVAAHLRDL